MEKRIVGVLLQTAFVASLLYACFAFHKAQVYSPDAFMNFAPAAILFIVNIVVNVAWEFFAGQGVMYLSQMDPLTVFFLLVASVLMLFGLFMEDNKFNQVFGWAFSLATFVAGYEAGRLRQRTSESRRSQAQRPYPREANKTPQGNN